MRARAPTPPTRRREVDGRAAIVGTGVGEAERDLARQFGFLRAHQAHRRAHPPAARDRPRSSSATGSPPRGRKRSVAVLARRRRTHRRAPAARSRRAATSAGRSRSRRRPRPSALAVEVADAGIVEDRGDQRVERRAAEPAGEPVAGLPVRRRRSTRRSRRERPDRAARPRSTDGSRTARSSGRHRPTRPDCSSSLAPKRRIERAEHGFEDSGAGSGRRAGRWRNTAGRLRTTSDRETRSAGSRPCRPRGQPISVSQIGLPCGTQAVGEPSSAPPTRS